MTAPDQIEHTYTVYEEQLASTALSARAIELAEAVIHRVEADLARALRDDAAADWMLHYIEREQRRAGTSERETPVCQCDLSTCPLKQDRVPREIRTADSLAAGIRTFRQAHPGEPTVLEEAQQDWDRLLGRVHRHVRIAYSILKQDLNHTGDEQPDYPLPADVESAEALLDAAADGQRADLAEVPA
jgi:hypothetical protein